MLKVVSAMYQIKQAIEKEYGKVSVFNLQILDSTPINNIGIDVHLDGVVYPFYVDDSDFEDVPLLIGFMIDHIKVQRGLLKSKP